jgi:hypothetical protein
VRSILLSFLGLVVVAACSDKTLKPPASDKNFDDSDDPNMTMMGTTLDAATDALPDGQGKACTKTADCSPMLRCIFPIALGCGAPGTCSFYTDPVGCSTKLACDCTGSDVKLCAPDGFAPVPVKKNGSCSPSDAASE